ncbi:MAG: glycoside hydrolase family 2 protein [Lachnospiraceae bacterium]|nr:glycoside hydrolase family 2 protein [Lachnospiraceae bacterium]
MSSRVYINDNWKFAEQFNEEMIKKSFDDSKMETVRIPHTVKETPFNYFDESDYQMVSAYRRKLIIPQELTGKSIRLVFEGAAHEATVFFNEKEMITHKCGYTAFEVDITEEINWEKENIITVRLDSKETLNQPPFGYVIDYMTYGGIYRDVYLEISNMVYIRDTFHYCSTENVRKLVSEVSIINPENKKLLLKQFLIDPETDTEMLIHSELVSDNHDARENREMAASTHDARENREPVVDSRVTFETQELKVHLWDIEYPNLYKIKTSVMDPLSGALIDEKTVSFGFRKIEFKPDGFFLNGQKIKIRGLNRHQSFPYVGYAMPDSMQELDAVILKKELGVNAVRTSHYPQSQSFINKCDEIGLLVFTEIPGWQHIGDAEWKKLAVTNTKEMILQYRNHPSVIMWGVRINESVDDDEFYEKTNDAAHKLDPTRPTGGVRCYKNSNLLEDVYTYNDFLHDGKTSGCEKKKNVTKNADKPYLISEYNGHMYPTKSYDDEEQRREHALRHARVLDAVVGEEDIVGSFGWCMFDYNTHKDFGSGDRICYHGVMDMFRNPKEAADIYAAEGRKDILLELSSTMDIGEHPGCNRGDTYIYSNADSVKMYKNGRFIKEYYPGNSQFKNLKHGPIRIDDYIGDAIEKGEKYTKKQAKLSKEILNAAALYGMGNLPKSVWIKALRLIVLYKMRFSDAVSLYNKYVGDWGQTSTEYRFEAIKGGSVVKTVIKCPSSGIHLELDVSETQLKEGKTYDAALVRIKAVDDFGNRVFFMNEPIVLESSGDIEVIGEKIISLKGGMGGVYVKTVGKEGQGKLTVKCAQTKSADVDFTVTMDKVNKG